MTIDLTAPVPHATHTCDECHRAAELFRLIGRTVVTPAAALCRDCFARNHG